MKLEQLPDRIRKNIKQLPVKFKERERIQLAELLPVGDIWSERYVYNNKIWWKLISSDYETIYYNVSSHTIIHKNEMDQYIKEGIAEEWDYHKHKDL